MDLTGKRVLVLGLGISGRGAAGFCAERGAEVVAADEGRPDATGLAALRGQVELRLEAPFPDPADFDLVVPSPGIPKRRYADRARRVWGDVELAGRALSVPIVAVTGTNGKSTTVRLVEAMLRAAGWRARAAGNLGESALDLVGRPLDAAVLEVSSFQLDTTERFRPRVAVLLNVTPDHLDRHGSFEAYAAAKGRIFANQGPGDAAVVNGDDPVALRLAEAGAAPLRIFRRGAAVERGAWWDGGAAVLAGEGGSRRVSLESGPETRLPPVENLLAALLAVDALGVEPARVAGALAGFRPLPHRMQPVGRARGALWVDDSKATNPGAARHSLESQTASVLWLAGGRDKGLAFDELGAVAARRARLAVLYGEAAEKIADALPPELECVRAAGLAEAVARAAERVAPGEVVLLAPACASFDEFGSFEERGRAFRAAVEALGAEAASGPEDGRG